MSETTELTRVFSIFGASADDKLLWPVVAQETEEAAQLHCVEAQKMAAALAEAAKAAGGSVSSLPDETVQQYTKLDPWLVQNCDTANSIRYFYIQFPVASLAAADGDIVKATQITVLARRTEQLLEDE